MTFDCRDRVSLDEVNRMIACNDMIIETKEGYDMPSPSHQSKPILFSKSFRYAHVYDKINVLFKELCSKYIDINMNTAGRVYIPTGTSAWFYKGYKSLNEQQDKPLHNHFPAFLSGIFYLKVPDAPGGGTEFWGRDNSGALCHSVLRAPELSFTIFPGWLDHCVEYSDSEEPRHVIAANYYVNECPQ